MNRAFVIINPVSGPARRGSADERVGLAARTLDRLRVEGTIRLTERAGHAHELAEEAVASGVETVIAWGGDGTINDVGRALVQRAAESAPGSARPAMGIVPGGSGNGLARELQIPFDPAQAIERALQSPVRRIDAGDLGGQLFFNVAGIGLDAHVAALVSTRVNHRGLLPYLRATARDLLRYQPVDYTVTVDGNTSQALALVVALANSKQYGFGARVAPSADLADGSLDLIVVEGRTLAGNLRRVPALFLGGFDRQSGITATRVREVTIRSGSAMLFHVDGEAMQGTDTLTARVHPGALWIRA